MIHPSARSTLVEAITPPTGYEFDTGIATTYSLDIGTLLVLPIHLAWLAASDDDTVRHDPIRLLEGLRRVAKHLSVFVDRGRLQTPRMTNSMMGLAEAMIHEVTAPHGGAFHPKVWVLRFLRDGDRQKPFIRLLVLSRNVTDDCSWDLNLCLEGVREGGIHAMNREIADFVHRLPGLSRKALPADRCTEIESLAEDVRRCQWDLPEGFQEIAFHVIGMGDRPRPWQVPDAEDAVVVSPFVTDQALCAVADRVRSAPSLVSRTEELALLDDATRARFQSIQVLSNEADIGSEEDESGSALRGLHAKAFVLRRGAWTRVFVGSVNCTTAAMSGRNVEIMAELTGHHGKVGTPVDWVSEKGIGPVLTTYQPGNVECLKEQRAAEAALDEVRRAIMAANLTLTCEHAEGGSYRLVLRGVQVLADLKAEVRAWPLTVRPENQKTLEDIAECVLGIFPAHEVTSLVGFHIRMAKDELSFGMELPLANPPAEREENILAHVLRNRAAFLRYLALLLGEAEDSSFKNHQENTGIWTEFGETFEGEMPPIFESLVRAFSRDRTKLIHVAGVVEKLRQAMSESGETLIPEEFLSMWTVFEEAMKLEATW